MGHKIKPTGYSGMGMKTCRYFKGDRPCNYYWIDRSWECSTCSHHFPFNEKILLIKLDSAGDVVRSTCIAEGLKKKYPDALTPTHNELDLGDKKKVFEYFKNHPESSG